ncbi:MAG: carboxypeptidase-like regulatory domain-containing protein, partial [Ilumatobacteraceae bacterium]
ELFLTGDTEVPVASAATDGDGAFTFARLGEGTFKLRFSGAGFDNVWYDGSSTAADAAEIETALGELAELDEFALGARPGSISGTVEGDDPVGAILTLTVPGQLDPDTPAQVAEVEASADGSFVFEEVPSPAVYRLDVVKPGFATESREVVLRPAQVLEGIEVVLRSGDGVIQGTVSSAGGPLGGATVEATDGSLTVGTVTLTEGDVGAFALRDLPTPGRYTVTVSRDGFASEARSVALATGERLTGFGATLTEARGSIRGTAFVDGEGPVGGVTVSVTGGDIDRETTTISQGNVGTYQFSQLPIPGTYTITFTGEGLVSQVRLVDLDPRLGVVDAAGVDATLLRDRAVVRGVVRGPDGEPIPRASVVLSDATEDATFLTADDPLGEFEFVDVAPGAYTLTASRPGTTPVVVLVNVLASQVEDVDLALGAQASLSGEVRRLDDAEQLVPFGGATVRIFAPDTFPGTAASAVASTVTDANGEYSFPGLDAPEDLVVAVYLNDTAPDPLDSTTVATEPGQNVVVPTIDVEVD